MKSTRDQTAETLIGQEQNLWESKKFKHMLWRNNERVMK